MNTPSPAQPTREHFAPPPQHFTLIEMLVVIAIIAILAALLMPSLRRALAMARDTECANNMHNLAVAQTSYCHDYEGRFKVEINASGVNWAQEPMWQDMLMPYTFGQPTVDYNKNANWWQGPRVWQFKKDGVFIPKGLFACPSITMDQRTSKKRKDCKGLRLDIGMNRELICKDSQKRTAKIDNVKDTGNTIMFMDMQGGNEEGLMFNDHEFAGCCVASTSDVNFSSLVIWGEKTFGQPLEDMPYRHGLGRSSGNGGQATGGFNVACVQGNVRYIPRVLMPKNQGSWVMENKVAIVKFYLGKFVR